MTREELEAWIERKLDEGRSRQEIRNALRSQGKNPELVDRVSPVEEESSSGIRERMEGEIDPGARAALATAAVTLLAAAAFFLAPQGLSADAVSLAGPDRTSQESGPAPEKVKLRDGVAKPSRLEAEYGEVVEFVNGANSTYTIALNRNVTLKPGETHRTSFSRTLYYVAYSGSAERIRGSVYLK